MRKRLTAILLVFILPYYISFTESAVTIFFGIHKEYKSI